MTIVHSHHAGSHRFRVAVLAGLVVAWAVAPAIAGPAPQAGDVQVPQLARAVEQAVANTSQTPVPVTLWQQEIAAAKARRSAGRKQAALGYGLAIVGDLILVAPFQSSCSYAYACSPSTGPRLIGLPVIAVGLTTAIFGHIKSHDADGEVNALMTRGPNPGVSQPSPSVDIAIPAGGGRSLALTVGSTRTLTYRMTW